MIGQAVAEIWQFISLQNGYRLSSWIFKGSKFCLCSSEDQYASSLQILCLSVKLLQRYDCFSIFQDGGRPPYWICYRHIWTIHEVYLVVSIAEQNLVGIDAIVLTMWPF